MTENTHGESCRQRVIGELVDQEVLICLSVLISALSRQKLTDSEAEELEALLCPPAPDHTDEIDDLKDEKDALEDKIDDAVIDEHLVDPAWAERIQEIDQEIEALEEDTDAPEVFEYWAVTERAAKRLKDHGEHVVEFCGMNVWGRTCTGQAILLDSVWDQIASNMEILPGQQNHKYWCN